MPKTLIQKLLPIAVISLASGTVYAQPGDRGPGDGPPPPREDRGDGQRPGGQRQGDENDRPQVRVDQIEDAIATIREVHPDFPWMERILELVEEDREDAAKALSRFPNIVELIEIRRSFPEEFKLHVESARIMRETWPLFGEYRDARRNGDQETMDRVRNAVRERVAQMFDLRLEMKRMEVARLENQIRIVRNGIDQLERNRDALIDEQLGQMLNRGRGQRPGDDRGGDRGDDRRDGNNRGEDRRDGNGRPDND